MDRRRTAALGAALGLAALPANAATTTTIIFFSGSPPPRVHTPRADVSDDVKRELRLSPLISDGAPAVVTTGPIDKGQAIVSVGVRHRFTGVLAADVAVRGWLAFGRKLPAGTAVYGLPMGGADGAGLVWCAPHSETQAGGPPAWAAICLPRGDAAHVWVKGRPAMFAFDLKWDDAAIRHADVPEVSRGPVDFPAMSFTYAFGGVDAKGWLIIDEAIDWGAGPQRLRSIALPPAADGATHVKLLGGEVSLQSSPPVAPGAAEQAVVTVLSPPVAGAEVIY